MSFLTGNIKSILTVKIKVRHDSYTDQVSRIFVAKIFLVASLVMGLDWFHDNISCTQPDKTTLEAKYINSACWITGFYIYPHMESYMNQSAYYGIPLSILYDGVYKDHNELCQTKRKLSYTVNWICEPMKRQYFAHYQWMPFYVASLAIPFYLPYIIFHIANRDLISLRDHLKKHSKIDIEEIVHNYFDYQINSRRKMRFRILVNFFIKVLYIVVNWGTFAVINATLSYRFKNYGLDWIAWVRSEEAMDFESSRRPTPGNRILPTFGFCEIHDASADNKNTYENWNKLICEISSNMLYQYVFLVLWFVLVSSIAISCLGLFVNVFAHLTSVACLVKHDTTSKYVYRYLTLRECEYLELVRRKNLALYGKVVRTLWFIKDKEMNQLNRDQLASPDLEQGGNRHAIGINGSSAPLLKLGTNPLIKLSTLPLNLASDDHSHSNTLSAKIST